MGIFDFLKGKVFNPNQVVDASWKIVRDKSLGRIKNMAEDAAKEVIKDLSEDVINDKINEVFGAKAPKGYLRNKLVEKSVDLVVDKVWVDVKDKL
ncbi:MAG: hypothetical protein K8S87_09450 [Planctomycetes bacterium]|nr:hypothetical protein [Planctomycetota bacterium]